MKIDEFIKEISNLGIILNNDQLNKLNIYKEFLQEYNKHTNLTRIIEDEDIYLKHFYDSLTFIKYFDMNDINNVLDLGTGAGFPGMVIKIIYPNIDVTLLDSNNKKITFLKELATKLNIDVTLINERSEEYIKNKRESFDLVISRAMANLNTLLELSIPYVKVGKYFIAMKGEAKEELNNSLKVEEKLGAKIDSINEFNLIKENSKRTIIIYKKMNNTNIIYPRKYDKILKNPL